MDSKLFKYKDHYQQQSQHLKRRINNNNSNMNTNSSNNNCSISSHKNNNNNQNSIFILNTATNNILSNNPQLYYSDLNDSNVVSPSSSPSAPSTNSAASSSVWSSASSTMCSPAAHALQKLFNCSSSSFKFNHGHHSGIESKTFISKSEILKKKSKFWKYLEGEDNDKNNQRGIDDDASANEKKLLTKSLIFKSKWSKSIENDNQNQQDLSELLEYSCSLCDNCRCMDCQIGYFDCENSDDSNSEYSFDLSAYEEDEEADNSDHENVYERQMELKTSKETHNCLPANYENCCTESDDKQHSIRKLEVKFELPLDCTMACCCVCKQLNCMQTEYCQQCFFEKVEAARKEEPSEANSIKTKDH